MAWRIIVVQFPQPRSERVMGQMDIHKEVERYNCIYWQRIAQISVRRLVLASENATAYSVILEPQECASVFTNTASHQSEDNIKRSLCTEVPNHTSQLLPYPAAANHVTSHIYKNRTLARPFTGVLFNPPTFTLLYSILACTESYKHFRGGKRVSRATSSWGPQCTP